METLSELIENQLIVSSALPLLNPFVDEVKTKIANEQSSLRLEHVNCDAICKDFFDWLTSFTNISIQLPDKWTGKVVNGTTMSFLNFYTIHSGKTLVLMEGEYPFHKNTFPKVICFETLEAAEHQLEKTPSQFFAVISMPFSAHGEVRLNQIEFLNLLKRYNVPTLIDFALLGLGASVCIDVNEFPNVQCAAFSLSKSLGIPYARVGWEYSLFESGPVAELNNWHYINRDGVTKAYSLIERLPRDFWVETYKAMQIDICSRLDLSPSSSVFFGLRNSNYKEFKRSEGLSRFCLTPLFRRNS
jgi:hypothetical protein